MDTSWHKQRESQNKAHSRLLLVYLAFGLAFAIVTLRIGYIQVYHAKAFEKLTASRNQQLKDIPIQRGKILTADGKILATSLPLYTLYADGSEIKNIYHSSALLADSLQLNRLKLVDQLTSKSRYIVLKNYITEDQKTIVEKLNIKGIGLKREFLRMYPAQNYLASVIGFSGKNNQGLEGIEYNFNSFLNSEPGDNSLGQWIYGSYKTDISGGNVVLSIRDSLQHVVESKVAEFAQGMKADSAQAIILDSKTGKILAAANTPSYNPNVYNLYPNKNLNNPFVGFNYEPGSTFKLITLSIALENKAVTADQVFNCESGSHKFFGQRINDSKPLGMASLTDIIKKSSNICAAKIGLKIEDKAFYSGIERFGLIEKTGIEIPGEINGKVRPVDTWRKIDQAILSFGQGLAITPLQMVAAVNVFANDGYYLSPSIIEEFQDSNGRILKKSTTSKKRVISASTASLIKGYMESVVSSDGTGYLAQIKGLKIAAKSGTSQIFDKQKNEYSKDKEIASFVGFFPSDEPRYVLLTLINNPKQSYRGTNTAAVMFREIAKRIVAIDPQPKLNVATRPLKIKEKLALN